MAIRAFLCPWLIVDDTVTNPLELYVDLQPPMGITLTTIVSDANADGLPDGPTVLVIAQSNQVPGSVLEQLGNLADVDLIPPQRPNKRVATLPASARADLDALAARNKIPQSVVTGAATMRDLLMGMEKYINPNSGGMARYLVEREAEFG